MGNNDIDKNKWHIGLQRFFHYEFEVIHPFLDGNGRLGRLWHTLLLSKWNKMFAWLLVESMIYKRQWEHYDAIDACKNIGNFTLFVEFILWRKI